MSPNAKSLLPLLKRLSAPIAISTAFLACSEADKEGLNVNDDATIVSGTSPSTTAPGGNAPAGSTEATASSGNVTPTAAPTSAPAATPPPAPGSGNTGGTGPAPQVGNGGSPNPAASPTDPVGSEEPVPSVPSPPTSEGIGGTAPVEPIPTASGTGGLVSDPEPLPVGGTAPVASGGAPVVVDDGRGPHAPTEGNIVVLYDGNGFGAWEPLTDGQNTVNWTENADEGWMQVFPTGSNHIITNQQNLHEDVFLHLEFWSPDEPAEQGVQGRGNSGIYLQSRFELQILDSYGRPPEMDGCGSIYNVAVPLVNACRPAEEWNTYEIDFTAPRYEDGVKISNALVTAWLNDQLVQDGVEVSETTTAGAAGEPIGPQPLYLQDHGDLVRFRNIWWIHK